MSKYRRVTFEDRCHIYAWKQENVNNYEIARRLGFNPSTIYREIRRNSTLDYQPRRAQKFTQSRYKMCRKPYKMTLEISNLINSKIRKGWSAQQISKRLEKEKRFKISHECIYQYIRRNRKSLQPYLRRMGRRGAGRYLQRMAKARPTNILSISDRPSIANNRSRVGDWERESMFGAEKKSLLVCTDRKSRYTKIARSWDLKAETIQQLTLNLIGSTGEKSFSVTNDRGTEFAFPVPGLQTYYCAPQSPFQRGTIENTIGLIRQYIKNTTDLDQLTDEDLKTLEDTLNFRPRKCLNYQTPHEVFYKTKVALAI